MGLSGSNLKMGLNIMIHIFRDENTVLNDLEKNKYCVKSKYHVYGATMVRLPKIIDVNLLTETFARCW